jgi:PAS domain S-box-containing protein
MPLKLFVRDLFIGNDRYIPSRSVYRTSMLRGYFSAILFFIEVVYAVIDVSHGIYGNLPVYVLLLAGSGGILVLNRKGNYLLANIILLLLTNVATYLYCASYRNQNGIYIFFITEGLLAMGLFEYPQKKWWLTFVILPVGLFLLATFSDFSILDKIGFTEQLTASNFAINFVVAYGLSILLLFFIINMNHHSEKSLRRNEASLIHTSEELKQSRLRFELAIKGSNAGIWEWNLANNTVYNSSYWKQMLGFDDSELNNRPLQGFLDRVYPEDQAFVQQALEDHLKKNIPYRTEFRMVKKDGAIIWVSDTGTALQDADGETVQMVGSIIDISERKEAEQKIILQNELLAKTNAELDRFVYSTSHDLKSPLSSLLGLITIAEKTENPEEINACLGMMKDRIRSMESFIKEITDYSRNARLSVKQEPVQIFPLIHEIVENLRFSEGAENIFVRYNIPPDMNMKTDENRFKVVINNLIGNSIKYYDDKKENPFISIEAARKENMIHISVEDNGIGIAPEHQEKIFDMFYRASEKSQGSGLGLYIVKETIEKLRGKVQVNSVPGKGTSFMMQFPVEMDN